MNKSNIIKQLINESLQFNRLNDVLKIDDIKEKGDGIYMIILKSKSKKDKNFDELGVYKTDEKILNKLGITNIDFHHTIICEDYGNNFEIISNHTTCQLQINNFTVSIRFGFPNKNSTKQIFWVGVESFDENACPFEDGLNIPLTINNNNNKYKKTYYLSNTPEDVIISIITLCSLEDIYARGETQYYDFYQRIYNELFNINRKIILLFGHFQNLGYLGN